MLNVSIRHHVHLAFQVAEDRCTQRHPLDDTREIADLHDVAHAKLIFEENEETRDDIFHETLRAEADSEAHDAGAGKHRTDVETELGADRQKNEQDEDGPADAANDVTQSLGALFHPCDADDVA